MFQFYHFSNKDEDKKNGNYTDLELIEEIIGKVNRTNISNYIEYLQGHETRYIGTEGNIESTMWIRNKFESFDLDSYYQNFTIEGEDLSNVIAYHEGEDVEKQDETMILCAHFDSINKKDVNLSAPGADDDASGIAAVIESARVLSKYEFNRTIMFCAWNAEEVGLVGSRYFNRRLYETGRSIKGVYNFDMIGYSAEGYDITIHSNQNSINLMNEMVKMDNTLGLPLNITTETKDPIKRSGHYSFWRNGHKAYLLIEEIFNPHYHTENDTLDKISIPMIRSVTRLAVSTTTKLSEIKIPLGTKNIDTSEPFDDVFWKWNLTDIELKRYSSYKLGNIFLKNLYYNTN